MKRTTFLAICILALTAITSTGAHAISITDNYWGGAVYNGGATQYGDVIQEPGSHNFDVDSANITRTGNNVTIQFNGGYFDPGNADSRSTWRPGDLYINSNGWNASNTSDPSHYSTDTFKSSEGWNYVISLADGKIYALDFSKINMTFAPSDDFVIRMNQALNGGYGKFIAQGQIDQGWNHNGSYLSFTFDPTALGIGNTFGIHWTMQCGNDVFETPLNLSDITPVPEPSTAMLLGFGLVGLVVRKSSKRIKKGRKSILPRTRDSI
jgi:hypothetical protein